MPHISSKRLKDAEEKILKSRLMEILQIIGRNRRAKYALYDLLSDTEMIMLAKRLSIIYLINKEISTLDISEALNVSSSTVQKMEKKFDRGGYENLRRILPKLELSLVGAIEVILRAGMPPIAGKGRWDFLDEY